MTRYDATVRSPLAVNPVVWDLHPPPGGECEDLAQEARIGLLAAIRARQPQRGPFPAFAARCVRNQALPAVKAAAQRKHQFLTRAISLNYEYGGDATALNRALCRCWTRFRQPTQGQTARRASS